VSKLADLGFGAGWLLGSRLPAGVLDTVFRLGADRAARKNGPGVRQLRRNLSRVVPQAGADEMDELVRASARSYGRYWSEAFRLPSMDHTALYDRVDPNLAGREYLDAGLAAGNGVVVALAHSGHFDVAGVWVARRYGGFTTVVERLRPESVYRRFVAYRESLGFEVLPLTGGANPFLVLSARLRANGVVCLVSDRDLGTSGIPVTFFGAPARMPGGPAMLAARTGAVLLPIGSWFTDDGGWEFRIHPPIPVPRRQGVRAATQAMADVFAGDIAARPVDWHMYQPLWQADIDGEPGT
jgi:phosphatidylinositol dimannoside acyltransferase